MQESEYYYNKASQDKIYSDLQHESIMATLAMNQTLALFASLKPVLAKDGDKWCCMLGNDLQSGISGFGETPYEAILMFNTAFMLTNRNGK